MDLIKKIRTQTGAGLNSVKEAIENSSSQEEVIQYLRKKGMAKSAKRAGKETNNGVIGNYLHTDKRLGVIVEVATETDFAAKSPDVVKFANDIALHIAAVGTLYVNEELVPQEIKKKKKASVDVEGKPEEIAEKIKQGKVDKFMQQNVLVHQNFFLDESKKVSDLLNELVAKVGEKIEITKFVRMQIANPVISSNL